MTRTMRVGAIDIGSNSIRLLVADVDPSPNGSIAPVARAGEACRLAKKMDSTQLIQPQMAERASHLVAEFAARARSLGVVTTVAAATAALRNATNGDVIARQIGERAGLSVRILTGEEEARIVYCSVVRGLGNSARLSACVVFDIGGGSTEVVSGVGEQAGRWTSLPFGAVNLTERFLKSNPPSDAEVRELTAMVSESIMHDCAYMPPDAPLLAGVGGTITVLAFMDRKLEVYEPPLLQGWVIPSGRLDQLVTNLLTSSQDERRNWPAMGEGRADIVVAGALVVKILTERFPSAGLVCSVQGLRYGLARLAAEEVQSGLPPQDKFSIDLPRT